MSERNLWHTFRDDIAPYGWLLRIENLASPGTPDLAYCLHSHGGWIEFKYLKEWPARGTTPVRIPTLTAAQCTCLEEIVKNDGTAWLCLQVGNWYGLLLPAAARGIFRRQLTRGDLVGFGWEGWDHKKIVRVLMKKV